MQKSNTLLKSFSGHTMKFKGRVMIPYTFHKKTFHIPFELVEVKTPTILGSYSSQEIGHVQKFSVSQSTMDTDEDLT